jgi:hypothetical protein
LVKAGSNDEPLVVVTSIRWRESSIGVRALSMTTAGRRQDPRQQDRQKQDQLKSHTSQVKAKVRPENRQDRIYCTGGFYCYLYTVNTKGCDHRNMYDPVVKG